MNERMSPISKAVLAYVELHTSVSFEQLCGVFCPGSPSGRGSSVEAFRRRINYMVSVCHLERVSVEGGHVLPVVPRCVARENERPCAQPGTTTAATHTAPAV